MIQTMEQHRAEYALKWLERIKSDANTKELRSYVNNLPALIRINGLGQAMAFYRMKGESTHRLLYQAVSDWLCKDTAGNVFKNQKDILTAITVSDMKSYMAAQNEALALLEWLKKITLALTEKVKE
ncbi:type III-B CRISPR module-associated protein Cmr5 [Pseudomonas sp. F1_0610]|uniref:type III-B CRISPR module-associated protein Cmr5 n=1 Tax=Pseudomonas sp. F1_0610 TaxID=3114284 RepID=UPI0039C09CBE